jgi:hypothetical protein
LKHADFLLKSDIKKHTRVRGLRRLLFASGGLKATAFTPSCSDRGKTKSIAVLQFLLVLPVIPRSATAMPFGVLLM